jgi:Mn-dependent DtxR family transcriptional regulator
MKKLTHRQQEFLGKFLDLYGKGREPLHYTTVAEHMGVSRTSAYEMLRLLEEHGLIEAEYQLPAGLRGPGRAAVMFRPTNLARQELARLAGGDVNLAEWEAVKTHILHQLEAGKAEEYDALLEELLARTSDQPSSVIYAAEMITTIILGLESLSDSSEARGLKDQLRESGKVGELGLGLFTGLGLGLSVAERINRRLAGFLLVQSSRFQTTLAQLNDESRRQVAEFTWEVMHKVEE